MEPQSTTSSSHSPALVPAATQLWEENFQDLSKYCQDSSLYSLTKSMSTGRENLIGQPDDELNTPEIGNEEFNFDSWSNRHEPIEDAYLWEENPLGKFGSGHSEEETLFTDFKNSDDLPDENNMRLISLNYMPEETVIHEQPQCFTSQVNDSNEVKSTNVDGEKMHEVERNHITEAMEAAELYSLDTNEVSNNTPVKEIVAVDNVQIHPSRGKLSLPLTTFQNSVDLNTPDVLENLNAQPEFDIINYVLEDTAIANEVAVIVNKPMAEDVPIPFAEVFVKEEVVDNSATAAPVPDESDNFMSISSTNLAEEGLSKPRLVVIPSSKGSVRLIIKRDPKAKQEVPSSSQKRKHKGRKKYIVVDESDSLDDDDEEYMPPVKVRKRTASCTKVTNSECSRYRELRDRNNEASRKSRLNRKAREEELKIQSGELETENQKLRIRAEELEKLVDTLRKALMTAMVKGKD